MGLTRTVEPENLAVALADAKKQCEVPTSDTSHDSHLTRLIKAATSEVERYTRRALITQTWQLTLREFPPQIALPRPPLQSVESITYVNDAGAIVELEEFQVSTYSHPAVILPLFSESWPSTRPETLDAITIEYIAGFGDDADDIPEKFKNAIYELVAFRFLNRGDVDADIPKHIKWTLDSLKCGAKYDYYGIKN